MEKALQRERGLELARHELSQAGTAIAAARAMLAASSQRGFEEAVQHASARLASARAIVGRVFFGEERLPGEVPLFDD